MSRRQQQAISKLISYILRHKPSEFGITLTSDGFATVEGLMTVIQARYPNFSTADLVVEVGTNSKQRFEYDPSGTLLRACQGHTVPVELGLDPIEPPPILYHGTGRIACYSIGVDGQISKQKRLYVHLSDTIERAKDVARRREGEAIILEVMAHEMHNDGFLFYRSTNAVWLTDHVPTWYIANFQRKKFC